MALLVYFPRCAACGLAEFRIRVNCRLPNVKACLLSKSDFLREFLDAYTLCQRIRYPAPPAACPLLLGACLLPRGLALSQPPPPSGRPALGASRSKLREALL
jgi:hypothetical protein